MARVSWWPGLTVDHLYTRCPARTRSLPALRRNSMPTGPGNGLVDPAGSDICGWCQRVWRARNPTTQEETHP